MVELEIRRRRPILPGEYVRGWGVLLTGVYGSGKSSVAEEIAYLLELAGEPYALLDLDYWVGRHRHR